MTTLIESILNCEDIKYHGFEGNFCSWEWNWRFNSFEAVLFHAGTFLAYAISVFALQEWVKAKKGFKPPIWMDSVRYAHNILLSLVSFWMFVVLLYSIIVDGRLNSWENMCCKMTPMKGLYGMANFVFLVSKLWEWVDTYFLVLYGKKVIYLHWFHHMSTFTMAAVTHNFPSGGFTLINCFIHTIMYAHYAKPLRWARPFITSGQLTQFVVVMAIHLYGYFNPASCYDMTPVIWEWWYCIGVVFAYFIMFSLFFIEEYVDKKNKKQAKVKNQ